MKSPNNCPPIPNFLKQLNRIKHSITTNEEYLDSLEEIEEIGRSRSINAINHRLNTTGIINFS